MSLNEQHESLKSHERADLSLAIQKRTFEESKQKKEARTKNEKKPRRRGDGDMVRKAISGDRRVWNMVDGSDEPLT